jgi:PAS domain S-box-containing protein
MERAATIEAEIPMTEDESASPESDQLARRLRDSERWFATLLATVSEAVVATDREGAVRFMNPRAEALTGWRLEQARQRPVTEVLRIVGGSSPLSIESWLQLALAEGQPKRLPPDSALVDGAGERHAVEITVAPVGAGEASGDEESLGALLVVRDVTDRRALQGRLEYADRLAALGTMAAGVAHELSNPLAVIVANLTLFEQGLPGAQSQPRRGLDAATLTELLRDTTQAADNARRIVADLRSFTQLPEEEKEGADVARALRWALQSTAHAFRHRAQVVAEIGSLPRVPGSEARLGQLFVNLLVRAASALVPGRASDNQVRVTAATDTRGRALVEVRDSGAAIPRPFLDRIFDPFFAARSAQSGWGLGLSVCQGIAQALGGEITVQSDPETGSTFRVTLPPQLAAAPPAPAAASRPAAETTRARILVIDDEPLVRRAVARSLEPEFEVVAVATAGEALRRLECGEAFELILCDLMMPEMTGMELAARLEQKLPRMAARMVFLSGGAFTAESAAFLTSVGNRFVEKPFLPDDLSRRVADLMVSLGRNDPET